MQKNEYQLRDEIHALRRSVTPENFQSVKKKLRKLESQLTLLRKRQLIDRVNTEQKSIREQAAEVFACGEIFEDVTTSDGSFHKTKVKKYPKLAALEYGRGEFRDGRIIKIKTGRYDFNLYEIQSQYGKESIYTRPKNLSEFLKLNCIMPESVTDEKYLQICEALSEAREVLDAAIKEYKSKMDDLDAYNLERWGLVGRDAEHIYPFTPKS